MKSNKKNISKYDSKICYENILKNVKQIDPKERPKSNEKILFGRDNILKNLKTIQSNKSLLCEDDSRDSSYEETCDNSDKDTYDDSYEESNENSGENSHDNHLIGLDNILENVNSIKYDKSTIDEYNTRYQDMLYNYIFINPENLIYNLSKGDVIKYSNNINRLNCGIIIDIEYKGKIIDVITNKKIAKTRDLSNSYIHYITVKSTTNDNKYWTMNVSEYLIFKYIRKQRKKKTKYIANTNILDKVIEKINNNKNTLDFEKLFGNDENVKKKIIKNDIKQPKKIKNKRIYVELTKNDYLESINKVFDNIDQIDNIIEKHTNDKQIKIKQKKINNINDADEFLNKEFSKYKKK